MVIRNFLFHRVSDEPDAMWSPMKQPLFSRIISHITRKYNVVPLEYYLDDRQAFRDKKNIATVLFDDGYKDNIEFAAPILTKYKCPASFYIVTGCIDKNIPTWTYIVDNTFSKTGRKVVEFDYDFVPERFKKIYIKPDNITASVIKEFKPWLKRLSNVQRLSILESLAAQCNDAAPAENKMMSWNEVRQLHSSGFIIGSHSHQHPMLASLQSEKEIRDELKTSAQRIKQELGFLPVTISYPIGSYDDRVINLAKQEGYKYGLAVKQHFFRTNKDNFFEIPRVELYQEPWWKVEMRMSGLYSTIKKLWPSQN